MGGGWVSLGANYFFRDPFSYFLRALPIAKLALRNKYKYEYDTAGEKYRAACEVSGKEKNPKERSLYTMGLFYFGKKTLFL